MADACDIVTEPIESVTAADRRPWDRAVGPTAGIIALQDGPDGGDGS